MNLVLAAIIDGAWDMFSRKYQIQQTHARLVKAMKEQSVRRRFQRWSETVKHLKPLGEGERHQRQLKRVASRRRSLKRRDEQFAVELAQLERSKSENGRGKLSRQLSVLSDGRGAPAV